MLKRFLSTIFAVCIIASMITISFANDSITITEAELMEQIADNKAIVTFEARPLSSFTQEEISQNPDLQKIFTELNKPTPNSINSDNVVAPTVYTTKVFTETGHDVVYRSLPKVTFSVIDVGTAGSSDIYSTFSVIESVLVDGELNSSWGNAIMYRNITGAMGCGVNTAFTNDVLLSGNAAGTYGTDIKGIIELLSDLTGFNTVSTILGAIDNITYSGGLQSNRDITSDYVRVVGVELDDIELSKDNHNLTIQSSLSTIDSDQTANQFANAAAQWKYDVYYFRGILRPEYTDEILQCDVTYRVNVK